MNSVSRFQAITGATGFSSGVLLPVSSVNRISQVAQNLFWIFFAVNILFTKFSCELLEFVSPLQRSKVRNVTHPSTKGSRVVCGQRRQ